MIPIRQIHYPAVRIAPYANDAIVFVYRVIAFG